MSMMKKVYTAIQEKYPEKAETLIKNLNEYLDDKIGEDKVEKEIWDVLEELEKQQGK